MQTFDLVEDLLRCRAPLDDDTWQEVWLDQDLGARLELEVVNLLGRLGLPEFQVAGVEALILSRDR